MGIYVTGIGSSSKNAAFAARDTNLPQSSIHGVQVRLDEDGTEAVSHEGFSHEHGQLVLLLSQQLQTQVGRPPYPAEAEGAGGRKFWLCGQLWPQIPIRRDQIFIPCIYSTYITLGLMKILQFAPFELETILTGSTG